MIDERFQPSSLLDSPPVLQNPSVNGMTVAWAVSAPATGWVEYGPTPQLGQIALSNDHGFRPYSDRFLSARITGLEPGRKVNYRVAAAPITFHSAYEIERGEEVAGEIHAFTTPDPSSERAGFAIINDTHENVETLSELTKQLAESPVDATIWNGDLFDFITSEAQIVEQVLRPSGAAYAANRPVLFTSGNHDVRGVMARKLDQAIIPWTNELPLGRCFAVRYGPVAIVGLDTGEDKPDRHPNFAGLVNFEPYREAQREWLAGALKRPNIAEAQHLVVVCHIPLWGLPGDNGGDTLEGYAYYCKQAQDLWHPLLKQAGAQVVISGHRHHFRFDEPTDERPYPQIVSGSPKPEAATFIHGSATRETLYISVTKLDGTELGKWSFQARV